MIKNWVIKAFEILFPSDHTEGREEIGLERWTVFHGEWVPGSKYPGNPGLNAVFKDNQLLLEQNPNKVNNSELSKPAQLAKRGWKIAWLMTSNTERCKYCNGLGTVAGLLCSRCRGHKEVIKLEYTGTVVFQKPGGKVIVGTKDDLYVSSYELISEDQLVK